MARCPQRGKRLGGLSSVHILAGSTGSQLGVPIGPGGGVWDHKKVVLWALACNERVLAAGASVCGAPLG